MNGHVDLEIGALILFVLGIVFNAGTNYQVLHELRKWRDDKDKDDKERDQRLTSLETTIQLLEKTSA